MDTWGWGAAITAFVAGTILPSFTAFTSWAERRSSRRRAKDDVDLYLSMPEGTPGRDALGKLIDMQMDRRLKELAPGADELVQKLRRLRWWRQLAVTFPIPGAIGVIPLGIWSVTRPNWPDNERPLLVFILIVGVATLISFAISQSLRRKMWALDKRIDEIMGVGSAYREG